MTENFLKLNINKSQLLICGKPRLFKVYQTQVVQLKAAFHIDCNLLETSKILEVPVHLDTIAIYVFSE